MKRFLAVLIFGMLLIAWGVGVVPRITDPFLVSGVVLLAVAVCILHWAHKDLAAAKGMLFIFVALTLLVLLDVLLRPVVDQRTFYRPHERFAKMHDQYPQVLRYRPNVDFTGKTYGDLAAMSGRSSLEEPRIVHFCTDSYGFCNDPQQASDAPFSLLVVGDSIGLGSGVDQSRSWASLLRSRYRHRLYNLSQVGNLYEHLLDFQLEKDRLSFTTNAVCLLVIFSGNDLGDVYDSRLRIDEVEKNSRWETLAQRWRSFRHRSAIRRLLTVQRASTTSAVVCFDSAPNVAFFWPYIEVASLSPDAVRAQKSFTLFMATMDQFRNLVAECGLTLAVAYMPTKEEVYSWIIKNCAPAESPYCPSGLAAILRDYCTNHQVAYCDLGLPLSEKAMELWQGKNPKLVWWRDDTHPNEVGNAVIAAYLDVFLAGLTHPVSCESTPLH